MVSLLTLIPAASISVLISEGFNEGVYLLISADPP